MVIKNIKNIRRVSYDKVAGGGLGYLFRQQERPVVQRLDDGLVVIAECPFSNFLGSCEERFCLSVLPLEDKKENFRCVVFVLFFTCLVIMGVDKSIGVYIFLEHYLKNPPQHLAGVVSRNNHLDTFFLAILSPPPGNFTKRPRSGISSIPGDSF